MTKSADGTPNGTEVPFVSLRNAEIRLKGNLGGSFRDLSEKPGLKLKFKKTEAALGLRKMTLNNSYGASNLDRTPPIEGANRRVWRLVPRRGGRKRHTRHSGRSHCRGTVRRRLVRSACCFGAGEARDRDARGAGVSPPDPPRGVCSRTPWALSPRQVDGRCPRVWEQCRS